MKVSLRGEGEAVVPVLPVVRMPSPVLTAESKGMPIPTKVATPPPLTAAVLAECGTQMVTDGGTSSTDGVQYSNVTQRFVDAIDLSERDGQHHTVTHYGCSAAFTPSAPANHQTSSIYVSQEHPFTGIDRSEYAIHVEYVGATFDASSTLVRAAPIPSPLDTPFSHGTDHHEVVTQPLNVGSTLLPETTSRCSSPKDPSSVPPFSEFDPFATVTQKVGVELAPIVDELREQWRRRQSWHQQEKSLTLGAKAMCRRLVAKGEEKAELKDADALYAAALGKGSHALSDIAFGAIFPTIEARDSIAGHRKHVEKRLAKLAASLPIAAYINSEDMRGVGIGSLAAIVGEAGDLGQYANPAKLWKRMGLAVMPDGRQRCIAGAAALLHGYSPRRRSVMWNIGDCIVKAGGPLRRLYDERKLVEHAKAAAEGLIVCPAAKIPKKDAHLYRSEGHIHNRAKRYVEKRVLLLLWRAWRNLSPTQNIL